MNDLNPFKYAMTLAHTLYGVDLNEDDFEELALISWNAIGNKRCRLYRYSTNIDKKTLSVKLPCNADIIEAVTYNFEDWNRTTSYSPNGDINSAIVESYIENRKEFKNPLYISGKYAQYERVGDTLVFSKDYGKVNILYKGVILDEEGLPEITDKEARAIALYCAYVTKYKDGIINNNPNIINISRDLENKYNIAVDAARVPSYLNQNDMDQILNVSTRYDRKIFNKKYSPYI